MWVLLWHMFIASIQVHINQWFGPARQKKNAQKRILREVRAAYRDVPFYRRKYDEAGVDIDSIQRIEDLKKLPFVTKDEVRAAFPDEIVARGIDIDKCHYSATTGSTGQSLPFIYTPKTYGFYMTTSLRVYTMIGYRPWHKLVYIKYTAIKQPNFGPLFRAAHIPSVSPVENQIARLRDEKPDLLVGYASIILEIAKRVTPTDLESIRPKFISVNSEMSTADQRAFISEVFGCPVYDEYSTEETWMIASQCKKGSYHLFTDNVWVEFLDEAGNEAESGQVGEMVLTTMRSPAMPFIRYRIEDMGRRLAEPCACGSGFPLLGAFDGRRDDSFTLPSGKFVSSLKILNTFTMYIKKHLHLMEAFKVVQLERDLIVIKLVKGKEYEEDHFQALIDKLHAILGEPVTIQVDEVDSLPNDGKIKRKAIESRVS
jgi:phenylacetate-CoA ligase